MFRSRHNENSFKLSRYTMERMEEIDFGFFFLLLFFLSFFLPFSSSLEQMNLRIVLLEIDSFHRRDRFDTLLLSS